MRSGSRFALSLFFLLSITALVLVASCKGPDAPARSADSASAPAPAAVEANFKTVPWDGQTLLNEQQASAFVGDKNCQTCHPDICTQYANTKHAQTLKVVTLAEHGDFFRKNVQIEDPLLGYSYRPGVQGDQCVIIGKSKEREGVLPADMVIGSGRNALTFLTRENPDSWVDLRISYYTQAQKWDYTPMQKPGDRPFVRAAGIMQERERLIACLQCHVTYLRGEGKAPDIEKSHIGIGCERCHGPGKAHSDAMERQMREKTPTPIYMERMGKVSPERISEICGACHRSQANAHEDSAKIENGLARFQGIALARSQCFLKSKTLSCITCHNPHTDVEMNDAKNEANCLNCHSATPTAAPKPVASPPADFTHKVCKVNPKTGCIGCHMPKQTISTIPYAQYHHHWIKVWETPKPTKTAQKEKRSGQS